MKYCQSPYLFERRITREVVVGDPARGGVIIGGAHPVVKQSMLTCDTMDQARARTDKGAEAAEAAVELANLRRRLKKREG